MVAMPSGLETASREELLVLIGVLQDQNTLLRGQVAQLQADNETLRADNERLTARVDELERRLGRNSGNSSLSPSSDRFETPDKKPAAKSARKRGRPKGAEGFGLSMASDPDHTIDHVSTTCTGCGHGLDQGSGPGTSAVRSATSPR